MAKKISGRNFDIRIGGFELCVQSCTLTITDNSTVAMCHGRPDGEVDGDVSAEGELVMAINYFNTLVEAAKQAGGWRALGTFDLLFSADTTDNQFEVFAHACRLKISELLNIDTTGGEQSTVTLPYFVTGAEFVEINGVPYNSATDL